MKKHLIACLSIFLITSSLYAMDCVVNMGLNAGGRFVTRVVNKGVDGMVDYALGVNDERKDHLEKSKTRDHDNDDEEKLSVHDIPAIDPFSFEQASRVECRDLSETLLDDPDISRYIKRLFLEVTPANYAELHEHASNSMKKNMFNRFDEGVFIKWKTSAEFELSALSVLLKSLKSIKKFKVSIDLDASTSNTNFTELIADSVQAFKFLEQIDLSNCSWNDDEIMAIIDSTASRQVVTLDIRGNRITEENILEIQEKFKRLKRLKKDTPSIFTVVERPMSTPIPEIARGHEDVYLRFINGKLIYKPPEYKGWFYSSKEPDIEMPFCALSNPLEGTFDLSRCSDQYLRNMGRVFNINIGYRKGMKVENKSKIEIWIVPRFIVEKNQTTSAKHLAPILNIFTSPVGIFWTWGSWDNSKEKMSWYDYLTSQNFDELSNGENLYEKWKPWAYHPEGKLWRTQSPLVRSAIEKAMSQLYLQF